MVTGKTDQLSRTGSTGIDVANVDCNGNVGDNENTKVACHLEAFNGQK